MRQIQFNKQAALKAVLLMVLGANVSWNSLFHNSGNDRLLESASETVTTGGVQPPPGEQPAPAAPVVDQKTISGPMGESHVTLCGQAYKLYFIESNMRTPDKKETMAMIDRISSDPHCEGSSCFTPAASPQVIPGGYNDNLEKRNLLRDKLIQAVKDSTNCKDGAAASTTTGGTQTNAEQQNNLNVVTSAPAISDAVANDEMVKECKLRKTGTTYTQMTDKEEARCNIRTRLPGLLSSNNYDRAHRKESLLSDVEKIVDDLRSEIRGLVESSEPSDVSEGIALAKETASALLRVGSRYGIDRTRLNKMVEEFKGYAAAGVVSREKEKLDSERARVKEDLKSAWKDNNTAITEYTTLKAQADVQRRTYGYVSFDMQTALQDAAANVQDSRSTLTNAYGTYQDLKSQFSDFKSGALTDLKGFRSSLPSDFYTATLKPFVAMQNDINRMQFPSTLDSASGMPSDLGAIRANSSDALRRAIGVPNFNMPNFNNYGNNSTFNGVNGIASVRGNPFNNGSNNNNPINASNQFNTSFNTSPFYSSYNPVQTRSNFNNNPFNTNTFNNNSGFNNVGFNSRFSNSNPIPPVNGGRQLF